MFTRLFHSSLFFFFFSSEFYVRVPLANAVDCLSGNGGCYVMYILWQVINNATKYSATRPFSLFLAVDAAAVVIFATSFWLY